MAENTKQIELNKEELHIADVICRLLKSGHIKIGVNIEPEYAKCGDGRWNISQAYAIVGGEYIKLDKGGVEIIDGTQLPYKRLRSCVYTELNEN